MTEAALTVNNKIEKSCLVCEKKFITRISYVNKGYGKYCSSSCRGKVSNIKGNSATLKNGSGENNANWKGGLTKNRYRYKLIDKLRYPEKHKAREAVKRAKKSGKLIPKPCFNCGDKKVHAHHTDYSKPLDVTWMCARCHHSEHH